MTTYQATKTRRILAALAILLMTGAWLSGCSSNRSMHGSDRSRQLHELEDATRDGTAEITFTDGTATDGTRIYTMQGSLHWRSPADLSATSAPLADIATVVVKDHGKGAGQGFGLGALVGGLAGVAAGFASGDDPGGFVSFSAEAKAGMGGLAGALAGGLVGTLAGGVSGATTIYDFSADPATEMAVSHHQRYDPTTDPPDPPDPKDGR